MRQCGTGILPGLTAGKPTAAVSHGIALGCLVSTILGLPAWQSAAYVCVTVLFRAWIIRKAVAGVWLGR